MKQKSKNNSIAVCGTKVDMIQPPEVIAAMERWINNKDHGNYISVTNAYNIALSRSELAVRQAINQSSLSVPDGISMVLLGRLYGYPLKKRVYGPDLMLEFLEKAEEKGYSNFFYGYNPESLELLVERLKKRFPRLRIAGAFASSFGKHSEEENQKIINIINASSPDVLWVGLGFPRQDVWMYEQRHKVRIPVMIGVGAAFDFLAGTKIQAPEWVRNNGFEWLFRLSTEPGRLWKRYLVHGSRFVYYAAGELIKHRFSRIR